MVRLGTDELSEWLAFDRVHPLPDSWMAAAIVARTTAAVMRGKGPCPPLADFYYPEMVRPRATRHQTTAEMRATWDGIVSRHNRNGG